MRRIITVILFLVVVLLFPPLPIHASSLNANRLVIRYRNAVTSADREKIHGEVSGGYVVKKLSSLNIEVFKSESAGFMERVTRHFQNDPRIQYIEPDFLATAVEIPNDPGLLESHQWGMYKIQIASNLASGWNFTHGSPTIKVAVVDSGIDSAHEDLAGKITNIKNCTDSITADDLFGHGTHVAGIISANTNNNIGVAGVGYDISLMNAKALSDNGSGYYSWIADCLTWSADQGASVINMSLGGTDASQMLEEAINYARAKGVIVVAAAGNSNSNGLFYPAAYSQVISVAASDINDEKAQFSNFGNWVDVAAPGVSILSTFPMHSNYFKIKNYGYLSGTSMAAPYVSGLAGLLFSENLKRDDVQNTIFQNADQITGTGKFWKYGRINVYKSLMSVKPSFIPSPTFIPSLTPTTSPTATPTPTPLPTLTITPFPSPDPTPTETKPVKNNKNMFVRFCDRFPRFCN
ncbi:peptidase S8 [Candidatus Gottesmanbacteria bacterium]|nr:peptidase S8 [Candidatus Gottesmanbacteria bacterium]